MQFLFIHHPNDTKIKLTLGKVTRNMTLSNFIMKLQVYHKKEWASVLLKYSIDQKYSVETIEKILFKKMNLITPYQG